VEQQWRSPKGVARWWYSVSVYTKGLPQGDFDYGGAKGSSRSRVLQKVPKEGTTKCVNKGGPQKSTLKGFKEEGCRRW
jgi:hypothetical protein